MHSDLASRRRTADIPAKPEAGLAEWTSRIKELQRQVDADEEAETKRLEEEIAASRLARMRRSTGRGTSTDLSTTDVAQSLREMSTTPGPAADREQSQNDTLKKLTGESRSPGLSSHARDKRPPSKSSASPQPISLAAFMGGRATGPRLNKHAPQQDAYDPTQFDQRTITAPHPIFGRGGIAMPGMAGRNRVADRHEEVPQVKSVPNPSQDRRPTPAQEGSTTLRTLVQNAEERRKSGVPHKSTTTPIVEVSRPPSRSRTTSTPSAASATSTTTTSWKREPLRDHSSSTVARPTTPGNQTSSYSTSRSGRHTPARSTTPAPPSRTQSVSPLPPPRTPQPASYTAAPKSPTTNANHSLAKPIQPAPRKSYGGPEISLTQSPSATYLRTSPAKEPTPSISRLQGRGFVQSMVKASSQVESPSSYSSSSPSASPAEKGRERKSSVLERWQHGSDKPPPIIAPKPVPMRKSHTTDPSSHPASPTSPTFTPPPAKSIKPDYTGKSLKSVASMPSIAHAASVQVNTRNGSAKSDAGGDHGSSPGQKRGLGSSTTMISYIKPLKTGDNPPTNAPPPRPASAAASRSRATSPEVDEMGLRVRSRSRTRSTGGSEVRRQERQVTGGGSEKPLSHPTKDRARKPQKAKTVIKQVHSKSEPEETPNRKAEVTARTVDEPTTSSFDIKNLSAKQAFPLESDIVTAKISRVEEELSVHGPGRHVHFPLDIPASPPRAEKHHSPIRHTRIPSTGNRATVMEVAQALQAHEGQFKNTPQEPEPLSEFASPSAVADSDAGTARADVNSMIASWGFPQSQPYAAEELAPQAPPPLEKRKSSQDKYSAFTLPTLLEEKTPVHSPASTVSRSAGRSALPAVSGVRVVEPVILPKKVEVSSTIDVLTKHKHESPRPPSVAEDKFVRFHYHDGALPKVDVAALFEEANKPFIPDTDIQSISVEVLSIQGTTATAIPKDSHIFYDTEVLAIIHRFKSKSTGLVCTKVWAWKGDKGNLGDREERKLQDLARRYNTALVTVHQYTEPPELVHVLGGRLATRQGLRAHWSAENTAMHVIRSLHDVIYIDELEPVSDTNVQLSHSNSGIVQGIKNLCSGFSYCLSLLETFYVWHGYASIGEERESALQYAESLASSQENVIELVEGESDEDEMFWLILGEGDYAKADYWRYKPSVSFSPRAWRVNANDADSPVLAPSLLAHTPDLHSSVHIFDCIWEIFVVVGSDARGHREDIRLALSAADELSAIAAPSRPFTPPVHVLVLPSQIPIDLRLTFRDLDETFLNKNAIPDHMNLLPSALAFEHLQRTSWSKDALGDADMLPLGLDSIA
ncbi:hypothetical protein BDY19DRAFT_922571 [Irpex rosettiformis]|uniref:Uncharacterized protein n=1 Tax=Irpex rosettiformis TaxID=378272 RepID=A0ACB8UFT2_9APHY|nr:hypothetical protein BDY19DRAFT_922571 [Irpex rosettiformis]